MKEITEILTEVTNHKFIQFLKNNKKLVLYGGGSFCNQFLRQAERYHLPIENIIDSNPDKKGMSIQGICIKCIDEILPEIHQYKFLITTSFVYSVEKYLHSKGVTDDDIYIPDRYDIYTGSEYRMFPYMHAYLQPLDMYVNKEHYIKVYNLLCDEKSKKLYASILLYRLYGKHYQEEDLYNDDESYFNNPYTVLKNNESFVDVGAYEGDSIIDFIKKTKNQYAKIYAIEANTNACEKIKQFIIDDENKNRIEVLALGVGETRKSVVYNGYAAYVGDETLEIYPLDEILQGKDVSIIKMDIEGMEYEALKGAVNVIRSSKPVLAICIYHMVVDIWQIIELIHSILPEYKFCIEQPFNIHMLETVVYAFLD